MFQQHLTEQKVLTFFKVKWLSKDTPRRRGRLRIYCPCDIQQTKHYWLRQKNKQTHEPAILGSSYGSSPSVRSLNETEKLLYLLHHHRLHAWENGFQSTGFEASEYNIFTDGCRGKGRVWLSHTFKNILKDQKQPSFLLLWQLCYFPHMWMISPRGAFSGEPSPQLTQVSTDLWAYFSVPDELEKVNSQRTIRTYHVS